MPEIATQRMLRGDKCNWGAKRTALRAVRPAKMLSMREQEKSEQEKTEQPKKGRRRFQAHETLRTDALNGRPLATFLQRFAGFFIDTMLAVMLWFPMEFLFRRFVMHERDIFLKWDFHEKGNVVAMLLYWGLFNYFGNGWSPGKWIARTRILSLTSERLGAWQSIERALGYGAALLEGGVGFLQFFWDRNRMCAQDRLAETIVVDVRKKSNAAGK
jgi:uncharacterized RDD family membrane protein YckC